MRAQVKIAFEAELEVVEHSAAYERWQPETLVGDLPPEDVRQV